ncbi:hypothetical protein ACOMHN_024177 [Nucella lapillus]
MFAKVDIPEQRQAFCVGSGDVLEAEIRDEMFRFCGDAAFYVSAGEGGEFTLFLEVKDSDDDDWLSVTAAGSVVMSLLSSVGKGYLHRAPTAVRTANQSSQWAMVRVPSLHKLMVSFQQHTDNLTHSFVCDDASRLPFAVYYGNMSSFSPRSTLPDDESPLVDGNRTVSNQTVSPRNGSISSDILRKLDCGSDVEFPMIIDADVLIIEYNSLPDLQSDEHSQNESVNVVFSFHKEDEVPVQSLDGLWDCSVPYWPQFQHHFPCDLQQQCKMGEDESKCFYSSNKCGSRLITLKGSCYFTINPDSDLTWLKANEACAARDGYLVSLNSPEEMTDVRNLLRFRPWRSLAFVGLQAASTNLPSITVGNYVNLLPETDMTCTAIQYPPSRDDGESLVTVQCTRPYRAQILCEVDREKRPDWSESSRSVPNVSAVSRSDWQRSKGRSLNLIECPLRHMTHAFLACDVSSTCFAKDHVTCTAELTPLPPMYQCACANERVPYSLVCDHRRDCQDNSDEAFCVFPPCNGAGWFRCSSQKQCVPRDSLCDGQRQCRDGSDEGNQCETPLFLPSHTPPPPLFLGMDGGGFLGVDHNASQLLANGSLACPQTHFTCSDSSQDCLPVFLRCNQVEDCPSGEDEASCRVYTCPGFFRCRESNVCLHPDHLCDGLYQCPQQEDEAFCSTACPAGCTCYGLALECHVSSRTWVYHDTRYLDASGSGLSLANLSVSWYLVHLNLARCGLGEVFAANLPNLEMLDLSDNVLKVVLAESFSQMDNLRVLSLAGNPLALRVRSATSESLSRLRTLDLSRVHVMELGDDMLTSLGAENLEALNMTDCGVEKVGQAFTKLLNLRVLDLRGCPMTHFPPRKVLKNLNKLTKVYAENYKLCCRGILPFGFDTSGCWAPENQLSSCDSLLKSNYYRVLVYLFASLAVLGNVMSMGYRTCINRRDSTQTASVFVSNLSVANFLMGLYLVMIAAADWKYKGVYVWGDEDWRRGLPCQIAGFVFVLSNEVSVLLVCLLTADRYLLLRCPGSAMTFHKWSAHAASLVAWVAGFVLASVPLYPALAYWEFYSKTTLCVPLIVIIIIIIFITIIIITIIITIIIIIIIISIIIIIIIIITIITIITIIITIIIIISIIIIIIIIIIIVIIIIIIIIIITIIIIIIIIIITIIIIIIIIIIVLVDSQTALCVPLPVSQRDYPGHAYSFFLFNLVKLVVFALVGVAQFCIYLSVRATRHALIADKSKKSMDLIVARRLVAIVMTDFLSWFPIGLLGLVHVITGGSHVTGDLRVVLALLLLPLNSALNPFLYTLSMARDLRKSRTREKIRDDVLSQARQARLQANESRAVVTFATRV